MRYLRIQGNFFVKHLNHLPVGPNFETMPTVLPQVRNLEFDALGNYSLSNETAEQMSFISQSHCRAWLLKTIALELHASSTQKQVRQLQSLLTLLFSNPSVDEGIHEFIYSLIWPLPSRQIILSNRR